jgi:hypothetical protein
MVSTAEWWLALVNSLSLLDLEKLSFLTRD